jgi:hypothetical protein
VFRYYERNDWKGGAPRIGERGFWLYGSDSYDDNEVHEIALSEISSVNSGLWL